MFAPGTLDLTAGDTLYSIGAGTLGGTLNLFGTPSGGTECLISSAVGFTGSFSNNPTLSGYTLAYTGTSVELVGPTSSGPATWNAGNGNWSVGSNWTPSGATRAARASRSCSASRL